MEKTNHGYVFCLKEKKQVILPALTTAVTEALCISTVPFTQNFKRKKPSPA